MSFLVLWAAQAWALAGGWWLEGPEMPVRADAVRVQAVAEKAGYHARVVKRFHLGEGWEFVVLVEGFSDEAAATSALHRLGKETKVVLTVTADPSLVRAQAPVAHSNDVPTLLARALATHGGPTGGVAALARAGAVHFIFERELDIDGKRASVTHDYWRDATSRRLAVNTHGAGTDSVTVATANGAWIKVAGHAESRDIGVVITQTDSFAPETVLGVALDVGALLATPPDQAPLVLLEGAESGVRLGRGEDPTDAGLAYVDIDPATGQLLRIRYVTEGGPVEFTMDGWKLVAPGVMSPSVMRLVRADGRTETIRVSRLDLVDVAPGGTFAAPENDAPAP